MLAMERGLHVLCEKPIATSVGAGQRMADRAAELNRTTLVPFTYRYMPTNQFVKRLIDGGFVGRPYHLNMRYFTGFARDGEYSWRFDTELAGSGVLGDIGSHWLHVARWLLGEVTEIGCISERFVDRELRPDRSDYERSEDSAQMTVRFEKEPTSTRHTTSTSTVPTARSTATTTGQACRKCEGSKQTSPARLSRSRFQTTSGATPGATVFTTHTETSFA
jgi:predicted dehydrogenase